MSEITVFRKAVDDVCIGFEADVVMPFPSFIVTKMTYDDVIPIPSIPKLTTWCSLKFTRSFDEMVADEEIFDHCASGRCEYILVHRLIMR